MKMEKNWFWPLATVIIIIAAAAFFGLNMNSQPTKSNKILLKAKSPHVSHSDLMAGPFTDGPSVTRACLECHPNSAKEVMSTNHWTWEKKNQKVTWKDSTVTTGKKHSFNNFCIGVNGGNWPKCTKCHVGYGWKDENFDFDASEKVDCLVCHDQSGLYVKAESGMVAKGVPLLEAAKSVGRPTRENCGACHFSGGGGNAVKHGDLDASLSHPESWIDVHMGEHKLECIDCHAETHHKIAGRATSVTPGLENELTCQKCHEEQPHEDERLNKHIQSIACQTCHIPAVAKKEATKTDWDWSEAGKDKPEDPHKFLKIKGSFVYKKHLKPEYFWWNGNTEIYVKGDSINPDGPTNINFPIGSYKDPKSKIWPFKVHRGKQIYDKKNKYLLAPRTVGKGGFWTDFDWKKALELGAKSSGIEFSGEYDFTETQMFWPLSHMVAKSQNALQCTDCHTENGRMDWKSLGFRGDPIRTREDRK